MRAVYTTIAVSAAFLLLSCGMVAPSAKPYTSKDHGFTISFPSGTKDVVAQKRRGVSDKDAVYMTANGDGVYRVKVINWPSHDEVHPPQEDLIGSGASPGEDLPSDADTKQVTFIGKPAIDSTGWSWSENPGADGAPVKMQTRVIGFREDPERVFLIEMKTDKKEKLATKEANDFFNSFKLEGPGK